MRDLFRKLRWQRKVKTTHVPVFPRGKHLQFKETWALLPFLQLQCVRMEKMAFLNETLGCECFKMNMKSDIFPFSRCFPYLVIVSLFDVDIFNSVLSSSTRGHYRGASSGTRSLTPPHGSPHLLDRCFLRCLPASAIPSSACYVPSLAPSCATSSELLSPCSLRHGYPYFPSQIPGRFLPVRHFLRLILDYSVDE